MVLGLLSWQGLDPAELGGATFAQAHMQRRLRALLPYLWGPHGHPLHRLGLFVAVACAVIAIEQLTRLLVVPALPRTEWVELIGPIGLARSDHYAPGLVEASAGRYAVAGPAILAGVLLAGHLAHFQRWMVVAGALIVGGSLSNVLSVARSGYVANWLALGGPDGAMAYVPADAAQVAGLAMVSTGAVLLAAAR